LFFRKKNNNNKQNKQKTKTKKQKQQQQKNVSGMFKGENRLPSFKQLLTLGEMKPKSFV